MTPNEAQNAKRNTRKGYMEEPEKMDRELTLSLNAMLCPLPMPAADVLVLPEGEIRATRSEIPSRTPMLEV